MADHPTQPRPLTNPEKAAALLFMMERPAAIKILRQLEPEDLRIVTQAATSLGAFSVAIGEALADELATALAEGPDIRPSRDAAQAMLADAFTPDEAAGILGGPKVPVGPNLWETLPRLADPVLLAILDAQHPQVAAFLMTRLPPDVAARLLGLMPMPGRATAMRRMLGCGAVGSPALALMEASLGDDATGRANAPATSDRPARLATILNQMDRTQTDALLENLAQSRPGDAAALRDLLFDFEDIVRLPQAARAMVFDQVATDRVVTALRGTDAALRDAVLAALGARARRMVEGELAREDATPARDIAKARRAIADLVLSLAQRGQITLGAPTADAA